MEIIQIQKYSKIANIKIKTKKKILNINSLKNTHNKVIEITRKTQLFVFCFQFTYITYIYIYMCVLNLNYITTTFSPTNKQTK